MTEAEIELKSVELEMTLYRIRADAAAKQAKENLEYFNAWVEAYKSLMHEVNINPNGMAFYKIESSSEPPYFETKPVPVIPVPNVEMPKSPSIPVLNIPELPTAPNFSIPGPPRLDESEIEKRARFILDGIDKPLKALCRALKDLVK